MGGGSRAADHRARAGARARRANGGGRRSARAALLDAYLLARPSIGGLVLEPQRGSPRAAHAVLSQPDALLLQPPRARRVVVIAHALAPALGDEAALPILREVEEYLRFGRGRLLLRPVLERPIVVTRPSGGAALVPRKRSILRAALPVEVIKVEQVRRRVKESCEIVVVGCGGASRVAQLVLARLLFD